jgi:pimeloyl-ACP methyl ester carboxylesterase
VLPELRSIRAGGRTLAYREAGEGVPVVLLHGIGSGSASWEGQLAGLGVGYRVIAWDGPGYGGSDALAGETPVVADYAQAAVDLLDALGLVRVHLVGHSLGALIAAAFAARRADRLLSLTLANPTRGYAHADDKVRIDGLAARIGAIDDLGPAGMAEARAQNLLSPDAPPAALEKVRGVMSGLRPDGFKQAARMMYSTDILADARAVSVPAMVMCGSADSVTPENIARSIASVIPGARYHTLDGLGHASYVESPETFNAPLRAFFDSVA